LDKNAAGAVPMEPTKDVAVEEVEEKEAVKRV
jgi:hypothetical protein